jgi:hypothetical protein
VSFQVVLPNGRKVELFSKKGADEFVDTIGTDFISTNLTTRDDATLTHAYTLMLTVADNASPEKIAAGIPESELRTLVEHSRDTLDTLSTDRNWLRSGRVKVCHRELLNVLTFFSKHISFVKIFASCGGMDAVAQFYASRKNVTSCPSVAHQIVLMANNCLCGLQEERGAEKAFGTLEKTGLLGQLIRCVSANPEDPGLMILQCLQQNMKIVKKKLKSGTSTGDILDVVIAGKDGHINTEVKTSLVKLQMMARLSNDGYRCRRDLRDNICHNCDKAENQMQGEKLMKCTRCMVTYYCNKECQVTDWKRHKQYCGKESPAVLKANQSTMLTFAQFLYIPIAKEVYKKMQEYNVNTKELILEVDFYGDAPALRGEFKVGLTSRYMEGSRPEEPDWLRKGTDEYTNTIDIWVTGLREGHERLTINELHAVCRYGNGSWHIHRLTLKSPETGQDLMSDEAIECIGRDDYDGMVNIMGQQTTDLYWTMFGLGAAGSK